MTSKTSFSCGEDIDIVNVGSLYQRLQKSLQKSSTIEIKADKVKKADTAGLQLFATLAQEVASKGGKLIWKNPSEALLSTTQQLGLTAILMLEGE